MCQLLIHLSLVVAGILAANVHEMQHVQQASQFQLQLQNEPERKRKID